MALTQQKLVFLITSTNKPAQVKCETFINCFLSVLKALDAIHIFVALMTHSTRAIQVKPV